MLKQTRTSEVSQISLRWQNFWSSKHEDNRSSCEAADRVRDDSAAFQQAMRKKITPEEQNYLKHADAASLELLLSCCLGNAEVQRDLKEKGDGLIKRAGKSTQVFANNFASYLQAYSGIIEIMQGADNQYGGAAYASLSLLLIVAVNKQRKEERIDSTLLDLQREFLRIGILKESHSSRTIKEYVAQAYRLGIEFSMEATRYYSRSSYRRILEAITRPPSLELDAKISEISKAMAEIQKEISALDSQRLFEVQRSLDIVEGSINIVEKNVDKVKEQVDNVRGDFEGSQVQVEKERLEILKARLLPNCFDPHAELERYSSAVLETFKNPVRIQNLNVNRVVEDPAFSRWENSRKSSLMLLHGTTAITRGDYSWLSPSVFHLITHYQQQGKTVLFHCCHNSVFMEKDTPIHAVISSLVYQVLESTPILLRDGSRFQEIMSKSSSPQWHESSSNDAWKVLQVLLGLVPEVYILLDRVDRILGSAYRFLSSLVNLIQSSHSMIKVFLVASSNRQGHPEGKMTEQLLESTGEELGAHQFLRLRLDQK